MEELDAAFRESGFDAGMPRGLRLVLSRISRKGDETPEQCRRRAFKRLFGILWFGNKVGDGFFHGKSLPTYVYPHCLKMAVREMVGGELKDYQDPEGSAVYHVTIENLYSAKWPAK